MATWQDIVLHLANATQNAYYTYVCFVVFLIVIPIIITSLEIKLIYIVLPNQLLLAPE